MEAGACFPPGSSNTVHDNLSRGRSASLFFYIKGVPICALKGTELMLQAWSRSVFWLKLNPFNALESLVRAMH